MNNVLARGVIEFIAVILGITVSFWCDGLSEDSQNENERVKVLTSLKMEIGEIKNYCDERKRTWNKDISLLNQFLYPDNGNFNKKSILNITTSKIRIETIMVLYRVFDPPLNRYHSIINSGDLKYVNSDMVKEILSRLHNTSFSYVQTAVEHEKQLKESFIPFLTINHPDIILARGDGKISIDRYSDMINSAIQSDSRLKAKFIMLKRYLETKISILQMYMINLDDLNKEIDLAINN